VEIKLFPNNQSESVLWGELERARSGLNSNTNCIEVEGWGSSGKPIRRQPRKGTSFKVCFIESYKRETIPASGGINLMTRVQIPKQSLRATNKTAIGGREGQRLQLSCSNVLKKL
jgi:hypothetical protein